MQGVKLFSKGSFVAVLPFVGVFFVLSVGMVSANCSCDVNGDGKYTHGILPPNDYGIARDCFAAKSGPSDVLDGGYSCAKVDYNKNGQFDMVDINFFIDVCAHFDNNVVCTTSTNTTTTPTPPSSSNNIVPPSGATCECDLNGDNKLIVDGSVGDDVIFQSNCTQKWLFAQSTPVAQTMVDGISCSKADVTKDGKLYADDVNAFAQKCGEPGNGTYLLYKNRVCSVSTVFPDVDGAHRNFDAIKYSKENGIVNGYGTGSFGPNDFVTRGQLIKVLINYLHAGEVEACVAAHFADANGSPFIKHLCVAKLKGIVSGYSDGTIRLDQYVTVGEALKMISNSFGYTSANEVQPSTDKFRPYINAVTGRKAVPRQILSVDDYLTRGDLVEIIYRLKLNINNKEALEASEL